MIPDFVVIGAPRCGTTSLARYLGEHPEIFVAPTKEVRFFDVNFDRGPDWYLEHFRGAGGRMAGEATPGYMLRRQSMERLVEMLPRALLLVMLRDPIERAWSEYWMVKARSNESRSFSQVIIEEIEAMGSGDNLSARYLRNSRYDIHMQTVLDLVDRERVGVFLSERMATDPADFYGDVCQFLGVDPTFRPHNLGKVMNSYLDFRSVRLRNWLRRFDTPLARFARRLNARRSATYPPMAEADRSTLSTYFAPHIQRLEGMLGLEFPEWSANT